MREYDEPQDPYFPGPSRYRTNRSVEDGSDDDEHDGPDPNYRCQSCGNTQYIDEHKQHPPNWCEDCESVQRFEQLDE